MFRLTSVHYPLSVTNEERLAFARFRDYGDDLQRVTGCGGRPQKRENAVRRDSNIVASSIDY